MQRPIYTSVAIKRELYDDINELSTKVIRGTKLTIPQTINLLVRDGLTRHKLNKNKDLIFTNPNGKRVFTYSAITGGITNQNYRNHIQTEVGLTPSPLIDEDKCWWGALDIDTYNMEGPRKKEIIEGAKELENK